MKNFDFIKELAEVIPAFHQLHAYCDKAVFLHHPNLISQFATSSYQIHLRSIET